MTNHDSDSSLDDDNEYTTTNVVLGYAANEPSGDEISRIGGHPVWLDSSSRPPSSLAKCKVCNDYMSLLLQLNADLQQYFPQDQRRLQVWSCRKRTCVRKPGSIRAFREVKKGQTSKPPKTEEPASSIQEPAMGLGNALFGGSGPSLGGNANPFSTQPAGSTAVMANPFSSQGSASSSAAVPIQTLEPEKQSIAESFADKLKIGTSPAPSEAALDPWPEVEKFPQPYPFFYLDAYPEELDPMPEPPTQPVGESSKVKYDTEDISSALDKDTFESSLDKIFQKFSDTTAQNPEQVLRYEFKGQPLLYSDSDGVASRFVVPHGKAGAVKGIPRCEKCGSQRVFEMQLTPYLIFEIEKDEVTDIDSGMEWGTIIVGTCINNCGEEGSVDFREEWVGVQWEERVARK